MINDTAPRPPRVSIRWLYLVKATGMCSGSRGRKETWGCVGIDHSGYWIVCCTGLLAPEGWLRVVLPPTVSIHTHSETD